MSFNRSYTDLLSEFLGLHVDTLPGNKCKCAARQPGKGDKTISKQPEGKHSTEKGYSQLESFQNSCQCSQE